MVDTEEEFDWNAPLDRANRATRAMAALPAAHARFAARGIGITYLVDHPVATSPLAVAILRDLMTDGRSAIGAQLHPWVNPPHDEAVSQYNSYLGNLPVTLQATKIDVLTDAIERAFAVAPLIFRAGRYGLGKDTAALLAARGYRIDSSVRAHYDYSPGGGPDYSRVDSHAFRIDSRGEMAELPLTTVYTGRFRRHGRNWHSRLCRIPGGGGIAARLGLLSRIALTPEDMPLADALEAVRVAIDDGVRLLNLSFHSPSVMPGNTPFVRDAAGLAAFHRWWDAVLDLLESRGVRAASHDEILDALDRAG